MREINTDPEFERVIAQTNKIKTFCLFVLSSVFSEGKLVVYQSRTESAARCFGMESQELEYGTKALMDDGYVVFNQERLRHEITPKGIEAIANSLLDKQKIGPDDGDGI